MKSVSSPAVGVPEGALDLSFGFDDPNFSDRTLLLHIIGDNNDSSHELRNVKRRRSHRLQTAKRRSSADLLNNADTDATLSPPPRVKPIHVTSLILAARSPFFLKLFTNGMQESEQKHVTLRIEASEEVSFMDLLKYVYSNSLPTTLNALLNLLVIADKFEVDSCLRDCTQALQSLPMTCESACVCLELSPSLLMSPRVEPLVDAAKKFLVAEFPDLDKYYEEVLNLPLLGFQAVISSDDLVVTAEIAVFDAVLEWVSKHYSDLKKRREILKTHLLHLVRFPFMTPTELTEKVRTCSDIDPELASDIVIHALCFKAETSCHRKRSLAEEGSSVASRQFVERAYIYRPVKVVELESPHPQCVVYFDLTKKEVQRLYPEGDVWSETIHLGGQELCLSASCYLSTQSNKYYFGLGLEALDLSTCTIKYEFAVRRSHQEDFESWFKGSNKFTETENFKNLYEVGWDRILRDGFYLVNDILHLRAELSIKK